MARPPSQRVLLERLGSFVDATSRFEIRQGNLFGACVRASLSKSYELCRQTHIKKKHKVSFFLVPSLRSICEDLIVLAFMARMPKEDKKLLTYLLMQHEVAVRLKSQADFFSFARPDQPILRSNGADLDKIEEAMRKIWRSHGWPNLNRSYMPPVRQIAEKTHVDVLAILYDYLYRLTSGMVHFNPQVLLRSGWGTRNRFHFSPRNFEPYYELVGQTYSLFLFCCFFELLRKEIRPTKAVSRTVSKIRKQLVFQSRWPEMVTFEEMNLKVPEHNWLMRFTSRFMDSEERKILLTRKSILTSPDPNAVESEDGA